VHEYAAVEALIDGLSRQLAGRGVRRVTTVRLRRGSAFDEAALHQAYAMLTPGTPLAGAALEVSVEDLEVACGCGHRQVITSDDLVGHLFVCPACGIPQEIENTHDLVAVEIVAEMETPAGDESVGGARCA
jgi:Zn finger protein HypA/HybF involved in hydrogenase expression